MTRPREATAGGTGPSRRALDAGVSGAAAAFPVPRLTAGWGALALDSGLRREGSVQLWMAQKSCC